MKRFGTKEILIGTIILLLLVGVGVTYLKIKDSPSTTGSKTTLNSNATFSENALLGGWSYSLANPADPECKKASTDEVCFPNDSEEMDFAIENGGHVYNSYIHNRPDQVNCSWSLAGKNLGVLCAANYGNDPTENTYYRLLALSSTSLTIMEQGTSQSQTWQKINQNQ